MKNKFRSLCFLGTMLLVNLSSYSASFDCQKARSSQEKLICSDPQLSLLDEQLGTSYKDAIERSGAKKQLVLWQRAWLKSSEVSGCKNAQCLIQETSKRITMLDSVAAKNNPAAQWNGEYSRFSQGFKDKDTAEIMLIGLNGNNIYISGNAVWFGPNAESGQVNAGIIEDTGKLKSGKLIYKSDGCELSISMRQGELFIEDSSGCGGWNVTFSGNYKKTGK